MGVMLPNATRRELQNPRINGLRADRFLEEQNAMRGLLEVKVENTLDVEFEEIRG